MAFGQYGGSQGPCYHTTETLCPETPPIVTVPPISAVLSMIRTVAAPQAQVPTQLSLCMQGYGPVSAPPRRAPAHPPGFLSDH